MHVDIESELGEDYKDSYSVSYADLIDKISKYIVSANCKKKQLRIDKDYEKWQRDNKERREIEDIQDKIAKKHGYKIIKHIHQLFVKPIKK